jgi:class 3 adenylate cyclase
MWRRHRERYMLAIVSSASVMLIFGLVVPGIGFASLFADLSFEQGVMWSALAAVLTVLGVAVGTYLGRGVLRPVTAWAAGDRSDPFGSWNAALSVPATIARSVALAEFALHACISLPFVMWLGHLTALEAVELGIGSTMLVVVGGFAYGNGLHVLLRPFLDEVAPHLPIAVRPEIRGWGLAERLNVGVASLSVVAPIGVTATVLGTNATMRDYALALTASLLMTGYVIVIYDMGIVRPTVRAVRDLLDAIDRVHNGDYAQRVPVTSIDEFGDLAVAFNQMQDAWRERESLRAAFGSYVDPTLAQRLLTQNTSVFEGEDVHVTVFFADVRGFTSYVEQSTATEAVARLNRLFGILVPLIHESGGHANHYLGDGLLAVFGTPNPLEDHADKAVAAAIEIQRQVRIEFGGELRLGIGINTGVVTAGTIGGGGRLEFTVIGDAVNVASRAERMTKETGDAILVTQATLQAMRTRPCRSICRGELELRGKAAAVELHALVPSEF